MQIFPALMCSIMCFNRSTCYKFSWEYCYNKKNLQPDNLWIREISKLTIHEQVLDKKNDSATRQTSAFVMVPWAVSLTPFLGVSLHSMCIIDWQRPQSIIIGAGRMPSTYHPCTALEQHHHEQYQLTKGLAGMMITSYVTSTRPFGCLSSPCIVIYGGC